MSLAEEIRTIEDLERLYYTQAGLRFLSPDDLNASWVVKGTDAGAILSTTTGVYNPVYGVQAWVQLNQEANAFGVLPKVPWGRSGWRVITARGTTLGTGGVAEDGNIPSAIKPTFATVTAKPKLVAHAFEVSEIQEFLASEAEDDAFGAMAQMRPYMAGEHKEHINKMLLAKASAAVAGSNFESIDRVVCSYDEVHNCGYTTNYGDIYGIDRDTGASWADAVVIHNSGSAQSLSDALVRQLIRSVLANGANPTFFLTGYDTQYALQGLYEEQIRYGMPVLGETMIRASVNGIQTEPGVNVGVKVATLYGYPVIVSKDCPQDTISRLYLLDTSNPEGYDLPRLSIKVAKPTQYFEAGINSGNPFSINAFANKGLYRTMGELICTRFNVQGKIRDLQ